MYLCSHLILGIQDIFPHPRKKNPPGYPPKVYIPKKFAKTVRSEKRKKADAPPGQGLREKGVESQRPGMEWQVNIPEGSL
jgi:hypothetical protein